jgi:hypothetical protein
MISNDTTFAAKRKVLSVFPAAGGDLSGPGAGRGRRFMMLKSGNRNDIIICPEDGLVYAMT